MRDWDDDADLSASTEGQSVQDALWGDAAAWARWEARGDGLSKAEAAAIHDYTIAEYTRINQPLRFGVITDIAEVADYSHDLSAGLQKLPIHEGTVYRGVDSDAVDLNRYQPGAHVIEQAYLSATTEAGRALEGNVQWEIESRTGRRVDQYSMFPFEREVLFDRFAKFEVISRSFDDAVNCWRIVMKEV